MLSGTYDDGPQQPAEPAPHRRLTLGVTAASRAATMMAGTLLQASVGVFRLITAGPRLSSTGLGVLLSVYYLAGALTSAPSGRLIDRFGCRGSSSCL